MNKLIYQDSIKQVSFENLNWFSDPFPHAIIDDFLPEEIFKTISRSLDSVDDFDDVKKEFSSHVEYKKKVYGDGDLKGNLKLPVEILGSKKIKEIFEKYLNVRNIVSLTDWNNYGGYFPFHSMKSGGLLGTHVDHSHSRDNLLHIANAIYYASNDWKESWGGETIFSDKTGFKLIKKIYPKPNRLVLFVHSSLSFHGVKTINSPEKINRNTYYMDYYISDNQLSNLLKNIREKCSINLKYTFHSTTFIPFFPFGFKSFKFKYLIEKNTYRYIIKYLRYLLAIHIFGYNFTGYIKKKFYKN